MNQEKVIPEDLADKLYALKAFIRIYKLLTTEGTFHANSFEAVTRSTVFLRELGDKIVTDVLSHSEVSGLPEYEILKAMQEDLKAKV